MAQNIVDAGDVKSGCVLKIKSTSYGLKKPSKGGCIPKFDVIPFPGFAHPLAMATKGLQGQGIV